MVVNFTTDCVYIPEWNNNKAEATPVEVVYYFPTTKLKADLIKKPVIRMSMDGNSQAFNQSEVEMSTDNSHLVRKMVKQIKNLSYTVDGGKEVPITDGNSLFSDGVPVAFSGLIDELGTYLHGVLQSTGVDSKN